VSEERFLAPTYAIAAGLALLAALHVETGGWLATHAARFGVSHSYMHLTSGVVLWAAASLAFLAAGLKTKHLVTRYVSVALLSVMGILVVNLYNPGMLGARAYFANARFGVALLAAAVAFAHSQLRHVARERCVKEESWLVPACSLAAGLGLLMVVHVELAEYVGPKARYAARCWVTLLWLVGWGAFLHAGVWFRSLASRATALLALLVATGLAITLHDRALAGHLPYFANVRFALGLAIAMAGFAHAWVVRDSRERNLAQVLPIFAGICGLFVLHLDLVPWLTTWGRLAPRCGMTLLWTAGAAAFAAAGLKRKVLPWTVAGLVGLAASGIMLRRAFEPGLASDVMLLLNGRVLASVFFSAVTLWMGLGLIRQAAPESNDRGTGILLCWVAAAVQLAAFSVDAYAYAVVHVTDPQRARFATQMALSIVWSLYAAGLLGVGFWKRQRPVRFAALGLFAVTTLKLLFVDLAAIRQQQVFRILSFLVAGILMIATSYLYHKLETHLQRVWSDEDESGDDDEANGEEDEAPAE